MIIIIGTRRPEQCSPRSVLVVVVQLEILLGVAVIIWIMVAQAFDAALQDQKDPGEDNHGGEELLVGANVAPIREEEDPPVDAPADSEDDQRAVAAYAAAAEERFKLVAWIYLHRLHHLLVVEIHDLHLVSLFVSF